MAQRRYLLLAPLHYSLPILRPLQEEILRRGDDVAWFIENPDVVGELNSDEKLLHTVQEVIEYGPIAVFSSSNETYDFFPGVKVQLFHGYAINKRNKRLDGHFAIRGMFDIYCTQGEANTTIYRELEQRYGFFRVYETGWCKTDTYFTPQMQQLPQNPKPVVLYSTTFTAGISSAPILFEQIERMVATNEWEWIIMFHPLTSDEMIEKYRQLAELHSNVTFYGRVFTLDAMRRADIMLCDSSSIIVEFLMLNKPVVAYRNTQPGDHLLCVDTPEEVEGALRKALGRPEELMINIDNYTHYFQRERDGKSSGRVLDAVDDFIESGYRGLKRKPLNLLRKWKARRRVGYYPCLEWIKGLMKR